MSAFTPQKLKSSIKTIGLMLISKVYSDKSSKYIYYHDIHSNKQYTDMSTSIELFINHINLIREMGYEIVPEITATHGQIAIGFDDGFRGLYDNFQTLIDNHIPVTLFLVCDFLNKDTFVKIKEVQQMLDSGLLTIGSHTCSHNNLADRDEVEITAEIVDSKAKLEKLFNLKIQSLCFPRGIYSDLVVEKSKMATYSKVFSSVPGNACPNEFVKKRNLVQNANSMEFKAILSGVLNLFSKRYVKQHKV